VVRFSGQPPECQAVNHMAFGSSHKRVPKCASIRPRPGRPVPEVWFRILHVTPDEVDDSAEYCEQSVDIALGPDEALENSNIGRLTRRVPASQVVSAVPPPRRKRKPPTEPPTQTVVETLRRALEWRRQLDVGEVESQAAIAGCKGLTRARVTQVLMLLRLAPDIQESILSLPGSPNPPGLPERVLRPIALLEDPEEQMAAFEEALIVLQHP